MISKGISNDISPQMKILNMVISILMHKYHFAIKKTAKMQYMVPTASCGKLCKTTC